MRFCDHSFCIYQEKGRCILKKISLDEMGLCRECILLDLPESEKESIKERMRMEFEERWNRRSPRIIRGLLLAKNDQKTMHYISTHRWNHLTKKNLLPLYNKNIFKENIFRTQYSNIKSVKAIVLFYFSSRLRLPIRILQTIIKTVKDNEKKCTTN